METISYEQMRGHPEEGPVLTGTVAFLMPTNASPTWLAPGTPVTPRVGDEYKKNQTSSRVFKQNAEKV